MGVLVIEGGKRLEGAVKVQGAKNAVLPILAATILNHGESVIHNCPKLRDVEKTIDVLEHLGCKVTRDNHTLTVNAKDITQNTIPDELMHQMRSSIIFMGAIISRAGDARVSMPGGCEIGNRPIGLHLKGLEQLGVKIEEEHGYINCTSEKLVGNNIHLEFPSVGATENIMLAACSAEGVTTISNAAREPEIVDLQNFLNEMGAKISGAGSSDIVIEGVNEFNDVEYSVMPDRIVGATYLICAAATNGRIILENAQGSAMEAVISSLKSMGCIIDEKEDKIVFRGRTHLDAVPMIRTMPYPGFPTDIQSPFMTLTAIANGTSVIVETIFENRFKHIEELKRMGADIQVDGRVAIVRGVKQLSGAKVTARELRGGAALVAAGLCADGITRISDAEYIDRGYEEIEKQITALGGKIKRI